MSSQEKIRSIESHLKSIQRRLSRGNQISTVVGALLLLLLVGYFVYGYQEINSVLKPEILVDLGQTLVDDNIPAIKQTIRGEVEKNSPVWAQSLSQQAISSVPQLRETLVNYSVEQTGELVSHSVNISEAHFDDFVAKNRDAMTKIIAELKTNEDVTQELLEVIEKGFNEVLQADFERDSQEILAYTMLMSEKIQRLRENKDLNHAEKLERQAMMILRRLQLVQVKQ